MTAPTDQRPGPVGLAADREWDERLSQPARAPKPPRSRALATLATAWRQLTSMRTALLLLFLLALAAVPGSLLPQRNVAPLRVQEFLDGHPKLGPFLDRLSGFDVFAAPWFAAIYLLLVVSLVGCVVPRLRLHVKALLRRPPRAPAHPSRLASGTSWTTSAEPTAVAEAARQELRRRRYRAVADVGTVAAEKGYLRESGNLLFHFSLVALLIGVATGSLFGYSGTVLVPEGRGFTNTLVAYDQFSHGALVKTADLGAFTMRLDDFHASYRASGEPASFVAAVQARSGPTSAFQPGTIKVNSPLRFGETKIYLTGHGYAPRFVVRDRTGNVVFDDVVPCTPRGATEPINSTCTVKVPDAGLPPTGATHTPQQLAFRAGLQADPAGGTPVLHDPVMDISAFVGDLHLDEGAPQNVYSLDMSAITAAKTNGPGGKGQLIQFVHPGKDATLTGLPNGLTLEVPEVREWAVFAVKHDPGKQIVLAAAVLLLAGLLGSLTVRRRRVWVRATAQDDGRTLVEMGGLTQTGRLSGEFEDLVAGVRARLPEGDA